MKFLIVALSALALASAQTTTVNVGLSIVGNADGSATVTIGTNPAITLPAAVVTTAKNVIGLINSIASGVTTTSTLNQNLAVTVDSATGAISVTFNGQTIALDRNTIPTVIGIIQSVQRAVAAGFPRPPPMVGGRRPAPMVGGKSRKHSNERRH